MSDQTATAPTRRPAATAAVSDRVRSRIALLAAAGVLVIMVLTGEGSTPWQLTVVLALAAAATVRCVPPVTAIAVSGVLWVSAVGASLALRLGLTAGQVGVWVAVEFVAIVVVSAVVRAWPAGLPRGRLALRLSMLAILGSVVARHVVVLAVEGRFAWLTGRMTVAGTSIQVGEMTRLVVVAAVLVGLRAATSGRQKRRIALAATIYVLPLLAIDQGPALLTLVGLAVAVQMSGRSWNPTLLQRRRALLGVLVVLSVVGVAVALFGSVRDKVATRLTALLSPDDAPQIADALNGLRQAGLFARLDNDFARTIPEGRHDMVVASLGSELGLVPMVVTVVVLLVSLGSLFAAVLRTGGRRSDIAAASMTMLIVQVAWAALANVGLAPITGISAPALAMTGSTMLVTGAVVGLAVGAAGRRERVYAAPSGWPARMPKVVIATTAFAVVSSSAGLALTGGQPSWAASLTMPRGEILAADGATLSASDEEGSATTSTTDPLDSFVGTHSSPERAASGLQLSLTRELTCGGAPTLNDRLLALIRPIPCHRANVVTSINPAVQRRAAEALGSREGAVVVLDAADGSIASAVSTFDDHTAEGPPGSTFKVVTMAAALAADVDTSDAPLDVFAVGQERLTNVDEFRCGDTTLATALAQSCNTVMGYAGVLTRQSRLAAMARDSFGAGHSIGGTVSGTSAPDLDTGLTDVDAPGATRLTPGQLARASIGQQEVRATALGVATIGQVVAASARGDEVVRPHVVVGTCRGDDLDRSATEPLAQVPLDRGDAEQILDAMRRGAQGGSAAGLSAPGRDLATKTGTADQVVVGPTGDRIYHTRSWLLAIVDGRWIVAAQVYIPWSTHENQAVPVVQSVIDSMAEMPDPTHACRD